MIGVKVTDVQAMVENHLKDMILKTFDPKKADTIFTEEGEVSISSRSFRSPIWMVGMLVFASIVGILYFLLTVTTVAASMEITFYL